MRSRAHTGRHDPERLSDSLIGVLEPHCHAVMNALGPPAAQYDTGVDAHRYWMVAADSAIPDRIAHCRRLPIGGSTAHKTASWVDISTRQSLWRHCFAVFTIRH